MTIQQWHEFVNDDVYYVNVNKMKEDGKKTFLEKIFGNKKKKKDEKGKDKE
jgi:hypothetical protein